MENYIVDNVQLLLFDLDDTLFDYDLCWEYGVKAALAKHGLTKDLEQESLYATFVKHDGALWRQFIDGLLSLPEQRVQRFQNTLRDFGMFPSEEHAVSFQDNLNWRAIFRQKPSSHPTSWAVPNPTVGFSTLR
jgi:FMN phosphatase YigB (HAD superfamily)